MINDKMNSVLLHHNYETLRNNFYAMDNDTKQIIIRVLNSHYKSQNWSEDANDFFDNYSCVCFPINGNTEEEITAFLQSKGLKKLRYGLPIVACIFKTKGQFYFFAFPQTYTEELLARGCKY